MSLLLHAISAHSADFIERSVLSIPSSEFDNSASPSFINAAENFDYEAEINSPSTHPYQSKYIKLQKIGEAESSSHSDETSMPVSTETVKNNWLLKHWSAFVGHAQLHIKLSCFWADVDWLVYRPREQFYNGLVSIYIKYYLEEILVNNHFQFKQVDEDLIKKYNEIFGRMTLVLYDRELKNTYSISKKAALNAKLRLRKLEQFIWTLTTMYDYISSGNENILYKFSLFPLIKVGTITDSQLLKKIEEEAKIVFYYLSTAWDEEKIERKKIILKRISLTEKW